MTEFLHVVDLVLFAMKENPHPQTTADIVNLIRDLVRPGWRKEGLAVLGELPDHRAVQEGLFRLDLQHEPRLLFFTDMGRWKLTPAGLEEAALVVSPTYKSPRLK